MIVDDECFNRFAIESILEISGVYNFGDICVEADNGAKAVQIIKNDAE